MLDYNNLNFIRTNSGRDARILMQAEDEAERVFFVKYKDEDTTKTFLRSARSLIFESAGNLDFGSFEEEQNISTTTPTKPGKVIPSFIRATDTEPEIQEEEPEAGACQQSRTVYRPKTRRLTNQSIIISIVGLNHDISDSKLQAINEFLIDHFDPVPFTLSYDYVDEKASVPKVVRTSKTKKPVGRSISVQTPPLPRTPRMSTPNNDVQEVEEPMQVIGDAESVVSLDTNIELHAQVTENLLEEVAAIVPTAILLNPFGESLTDADIQYAFNNCDENEDGRVSFKEFNQTIQTLGLELDSRTVKDIFKAADTDGNKVLTLNEFRNALQSLDSTAANFSVWNSMLTASRLDMKPTKKDKSLDQIKTLLGSKRSNWRDRIDAMHSFAKHAVQKMPKKKFDELMRPIREPLIVQLTDRRSAVVRECCIVIAKIAMIKQSKFTRWAPRILEALFVVIRQNIEIIALSGHQAAKAIIRTVPDNKKLEILNALINASKEQYITVRCRAFEYIYLVIEQTRVEAKRNPKGFWKKMQQVILKGMKDPNSDVRRQASLACCQLYVLNQTRTEENVINKLRSATQRVFRGVLEEFLEQGL